MEEFYSKLSKRIDNKSVQGERECRLWVGSKSAAGYGRMSVIWPNFTPVMGKSQTVIKVHRLVMMIKFKFTPLTFPMNNINGLQVECSHLCHNKCCVNPEHITIETHEINMLRCHCKLQKMCSKDHTPHCIL